MLIWKPNDDKWRHHDVITKDIGKIRTSSKPNKIYIIRKVFKSYPKCAFYWIWATASKELLVFCQMLALFMIPLTKYGHVMWPKMQISKFFYFVVILHLIFLKATKFQVEKLPTSEVISKGVGGKHPSPVSLGLILFLLYKSLCGLFADYLRITFISLAPILICYCYSNFITLLLLCTTRGLLAD